MKKFIWGIILIFPILVQAQYKSSIVKLGIFSPSSTETGFIIGYESNKFIDRNFDIGWSIDWFHKSYIDQTLVSRLNDYNGYFDSKLNELRAETNLHSIPAQFIMKAKFPINPRLTSYALGGVGAEVLLVSYRNYRNTDQDDFDIAADFNWRLGFGAAYAIGRRSDIFAEITYHSSSPSWSYEINDSAIGTKRIFERAFDMSGFMLRIGFKFYY